MTLTEADLQKLLPLEAQVLRRRFGVGVKKQTSLAIAQDMGMTPARVDALVVVALRRLRLRIANGES
jgi:DNA-directed RNA polymerase sigma subunit (sigma70/sigma32)